jgi:hypothetical protein
MAWRSWRARGKRNFISRRTAFDFANGIALFPQTLMLLCVLSTTIIDGLVAASKLSLCVAGSFALIALLEETFQPEEQGRRRTADPACRYIGDCASRGRPSSTSGRRARRARINRGKPTPFEFRTCTLAN